MSDVHPYSCPNCETAIRATNVEYLYDDGSGSGEVIPYPCDTFSEYSTTDGKQLHYCPNEDCRIIRLFPGERDEE